MPRQRDAYANPDPARRRFACCSFLLRKVGRKLIARPIRRRLACFEAATHRPREVQEALLRDILAAPDGTAFGRDHRFDAIRTVEDFRRQVPVAGYEYVEPYMARVRRGETNALLADPRVHMFALTSGTTATRKYIPVTPQYLADYKRGWNIWGLKVFRDHPEVPHAADRANVRRLGRVPHRVRRAVRRRDRPDGARCRSASSAGFTACRRAVGRIKDALAKYYVALRLSMPRKVGMIIAANPSTLINLARTGDQEKESLIRDFPTARCRRDFDVPARHARCAAAAPAALTRSGRASWKRSSPARARCIRSDYWAADCLLGNWTGGSIGAYLRHYPRYFGALPVRDVGLIASEGRMTIPLSDGTPAGVLDVTSHYFEFIPEEEMEKSATDGAMRPRASRRPQLLHSADDGFRPISLRHPRRGARGRLSQ